MILLRQTQLTGSQIEGNYSPVRLDQSLLAEAEAPYNITKIITLSSKTGTTHPELFAFYNITTGWTELQANAAINVAQLQIDSEGYRMM